MILYKPGNWSLAFAFSLRGSVFPKACSIALPAASLSIALHWMFHLYPDQMNGTGFTGDVAVTVLSGFTFILGFLVVFRSSQAYSRWWEGGTLLQQLRGEWFNSYSCLLAFTNVSKDKEAEARAFQHQLIRLFSLLYGCALQQVTTLEEKKFELIELDGLAVDSLEYLQTCNDRCEVVLQWIQRLIVESNSSEVIKIAPPILSRVFNELGNGIVNLNNARKITEFPIPFPLAQMITVMLLFHAVVTPVVCASMLDTWFLAGLITFVVITAFWSINYIAIELEMPFGGDANDLPIHDMQRDMNRSLISLIDQRAQRVPKFTFNYSRHTQTITRDVDFDNEFCHVEDVAEELYEPGSSSALSAAKSQLFADSIPPQALPPQLIQGSLRHHAPAEQSLSLLQAALSEAAAPSIKEAAPIAPLIAPSLASPRDGTGADEKASKAYDGRPMKRTFTFEEEDRELVRVSTRIEEQLARIGTELRLISGSCRPPNGDIPPWQLFSGCSRR